MIRNSASVTRTVLLIIGSALFLLCSSGFATNYYIAANGSDANSGLDTAHPWAHAPGMPNCASACLTKQTAGLNVGDRFIFKGGDTWHFGNAAAAPYTGGAWGPPWPSTYADNTCIYGSSQSLCVYFGVDQTWFTGASWTRPILTGDNPTSLSPVASCAYVSPGGGAHGMIAVGAENIFDNFEITGFCVDTTPNILLNPISVNQVSSFITNVYIHGWSVTNANYAGSGMTCSLIGGNNNTLVTMHHIVIDGSDSKSNVCAWAGAGPSFYHFYDSYVGHTTQGVGQKCHNIHDNIFEYFDNPLTDTSTSKTHGNLLECNTDLAGNAPSPNPQNTPNVFYNNIARHATTNFTLAGHVVLWFAPRGSADEYWFNNIVYDVGNENYWDVCWPAVGDITSANCGALGSAVGYTGKIRMFNNILVDGTQPCPPTGNGSLMAVYNEHFIHTTTTTTGYTCATISDSSNVQMTDAVAVSLGFGTYTGLINTQNQGTINCANESTTPCSSVLATSPTVGVGANFQQYCTLLAGYTQEPAISVDAANACKYGTTDGCTYNNGAGVHAMVCPAHTAVVRPPTAAWDAGAYQFSITSSQAPLPPSLLQVSVQ